MNRVVELLLLLGLGICIGLVGYAISLIPEYIEWVKQCEAMGGVVIPRRHDSICLDVKEIKLEPEYE